MHSLHRLRYVTERFDHLQGLRLIPLGIPFLFSALWRDGHLTWVPWTSGSGPRLWFAGLLLLALALSFAAKAYYRRQFGYVRAGVSPTAPLAAAIFTGLFIVAALVNLEAESAVSAPALIVALGLGYVGLSGGETRWHYLVVAAFVAVFAMLGQFGVPFQARNVLFDQLVAAGLVVIGLGDHVLLRRTLVPVSHVDAV